MAIVSNLSARRQAQRLDSAFFRVNPGRSFYVRGAVAGEFENPLEAVALVVRATGTLRAISVGLAGATVEAIPDNETFLTLLWTWMRARAAARANSIWPDTETLSTMLKMAGL